MRLIHTHLKDEPLSRDDLTDLALLRLDMVAAISQPEEKRPIQITIAHLLPAGETSNVRIIGPISHSELNLDFDRMITALEEEFARTADSAVEAETTQRAVLIHTSDLPASRAESRIEEMKELSRTAGLHIAGVVRQRRKEPDPRYVVGKGKLEETVLTAMQADADTLLFDLDLHPSQARAVTDLTDLKVIDRTMLILDIFAQRAISRAGKIQVELAQLRYALPRLVAKNTMMSRLTGQIGGRGPGETKLEINRRRARQRLTDLEHQIDQLSRQRAVRRQLRERRGLPVVALVGYTNAGKSTLLNTLTESSVLTEDRLFATLDPTSRRLRFPHDQEIIIIDTVGFIHDLPKDLVRAFRATLEELNDADLIVNVVDGADPRHEEKMEAVIGLLDQMGLAQKPRITVFNKADLIRDPTIKDRFMKQEGMLISAISRETTRSLMEQVRIRLFSTQDEKSRDARHKES